MPTLVISSSIHHRKIRPPRPDGLAVLLRHHARRLRDVAEIVRHPGGEQLPQRHRSERRMHSLERQLAVGQPPAAKSVEVARPELLELVEELRDALSLALA